MDVPANIRQIVQRIQDVTKDGPRFGCQFKVDIEGLPNVSIQMKSFSLPPMKGSEASEHVQGVEIPMDGIKQFGGEEGFPCLIKLKRGGKQLTEIINLFYSSKRIPKTRTELIGPGETASEGEIIDFYGGKISVDATSLEDDSNTENLALEGTFKYNYWLPGD